jgi:hypothetical protein
VQIRLPGFDLDLLARVGGRVRDLFAEQAQAAERALAQDEMTPAERAGAGARSVDDIELKL